MAKEASAFEGDLSVQSLAETEELARRIAPELRAGDAVALKGQLGAGKTTLARAILRALGVEGDVPSPSFAMVQEYETPRLRVLHCDLYRLAHPSEVGELGIDDALRDSAVLIEWPERAGRQIPADALWIDMKISGEMQRRVHLSGPARWSIVGVAR